MGGSDGDKARVIQTLLFVAGINTLLQALFGTRLPAILGGSYAYVIPIAYIINDSSLQRISDRHERFIQTMRAIQGALIVASSIQIILGYSQVWGLFSRFFSPLGMAPVVALVGLGLFQRGFPLLGNCVEIGLPMLLLVIGVSQYLKHVRPIRDVPIFERFPVLICVAIIWIYSLILTASGAYRDKPNDTQNNCRTDRANLISSAPWFKFPYPLQWGPPTFSAGHSFAMMSAVLVSMVESTGAYKAASRLAIATPPPAYVLSRGIGWQGIGILLDGLFGTCTGSTVSVENVGLLGLSRVGSRRVVQLSAGFMMFFSTLGIHTLLQSPESKENDIPAIRSIYDSLSQCPGIWLRLKQELLFNTHFWQSIKLILSQQEPRFAVLHLISLFSWKPEIYFLSFNRYFNIIFPLYGTSRKIWSCVCIHTLPNICCTVLCSIWPCGFSWIIISSIHKHELHEKPHYYRAISLPWTFHPTIL
ncbi:Xanthine/uracil permease family protein isoform 2 [Theobroma cacao]|uniref:Xanthine/uracil permease family protein isoform 2 n=1 Tax=Theobroma cacao TaxID=3641 RepID=A0A061DKL4_THECC|nr:Xanthine/uracil permease family protein isoform 2 [Theobroma cacao]